MGEEIDERAGGRFYGIAVGIDSVRLDGSQVPGGKNADLAIKWRYRDPTRRITLDLPRSKTGKPASSTICCRPCTARATRCYSRGDVAHEPDLRSRHSGWAPLSRTRQCERQPLGGPKSLVWVKVRRISTAATQPVILRQRKCARTDDMADQVESRMGAVAWGRWPTPRFPSHRVGRGSHPPPPPTDRSVRISRTTLFGRWFTALREPAAPDRATAAVVGAVEPAL